MAAMNREQLLDYIKTAIGLETDIVIQQDVIRQYDENSLARKPQLQLEKEPVEPVEPIYYNGLLSFGGALTIPVFGGICIIFGLLSLSGSAVGGILLCLIGLFILYPFVSAHNSSKKENENKRIEYDTQMNDYQIKLPKIRERNADASRRYDSDLQTWQTDDTSNRAVLTEYLEQTQSTLNKLYDLDYIYPKYRTLPALTSIYEYLVTGRCEELSGPHGAYNLYEDEVRKDTVISQLNTVIANLEQIKQNQYMLYQQVKAIQKNTSVIAAEITQIRGYTAAITQLSALNAYYSALTARNTGITAAYNLLN